MLSSRRSLLAIVVLCLVATSFALTRRAPATADATQPQLASVPQRAASLSIAPPEAAPPVGSARSAHAKRASPASATPFLDFAAARAPAPTSRYADLPITFEENRGQSDPAVKYLARGEGYTLFLTSRRAVLSLRCPQPDPQDAQAAADDIGVPLSPAAAAGQRLARQDPKNRTAKWLRAALEFEFASAHSRLQNQPKLEALEQLGTISNYYIGNDPARWQTGISNYRKVVYRDAYPGVDVAYYGNPAQLEADFVVKPRANPRSIRLHVNGATQIRSSGDGGLLLSTAGGDVRLHKPVAYQMDPRTGARHEVAANYVLRGSRTIAFDVAAYDAVQPLVIDPTLSYSTLLGGSTNDEGLGIAVDAAGEAYVTGFTQSADFPTQTPSQGALAGNENAYVTKFAANGSSLVFSTYLGGKNIDFGNAIAVDSAGSAYVVGSTNSADFPLQLPLTGQSTLTGAGCGFVSQFSSTGKLSFSTFLCGGTLDQARAVAVDANMNIYVTGDTESLNFPTVNPTQGALAGQIDSFVTKLAPVTTSGSSIIFSTYFGGNNLDQGLGIAIDGANPPHIFIAGSSNSTQFPTVNAFQPNNNSPLGGQNGFIAEFNVPPVGAGAPSTLYATFIGGSLADQCKGIAVDAAGNAYVVGTVQSPDFPLKNSLQALDTQGDAFVAKVAAGGGPNSLDFSTAFGGGGEFGNAIALDNANPPNIYFTGKTQASIFPTRIPLQAVFAQTSEGGAAFVAELKNDGSDYIFSTYLQGSSPLSFEGDRGEAIAADSSGSVYVAGDAATLDFPTVNPFDGTIKVLGFNTTAFVSKISPATPAGDQVFPISLDFGSVVVKSPANGQIVTLVAGSNDVNISNVTLTGTDAADFTEFTTCGADVPPTVVCNFTIGFTPGALGTRNATITITEASGNHVINLTGNGVNTPPTPPTGTLTFNNTPLVFGNQEVDTTSIPQSFSVTITGNVPVTLSASGNTGADPSDFFSVSAATNPCTLFFPIAAGTTCNVGVSFFPTATGLRSANFQLSGNFTGSPLSVAVSGTGVPRIAALTPISLNFATQPINTTSAGQTLTLTNTGGGPSLTVQNITFLGPFGGTGTCFATPAGPVVLTNGQSCTINVTFTPTTAGNFGGSVNVQDSDPQNPTQSAGFFGIGLNPNATLFIESPFVRDLSFGRVPVGAPAPHPQSAFLENLGNTNLNVAAAFSGPNAGDFQNAGGCATPVAPGNNCAISFSFTPAAAGPAFATVTLTGTDPANNPAIGSPQNISLGGQGIAPTTAKLLPNPLVFPGTPVLSASPVQFAFLSNTGPTADFITSIAIGGADPSDFTVNSGTAPFTTVCTQGQSLNAQGTCVIGVVFNPTVAGPRTATLIVTDSATGTPQQIPLQGSQASGPPVVQLSTATLAFGAQVLNQPTAEQVVTVTNTGGGALNFTNLSVTGDFQCFAMIGQTCPLPNQQTQNPACSAATPLVPNTSCDISISFTPTALGNRNGTLTITDNAGNSPQTVSLTGVGVTGQLTVTPNAINFPTQIVNTTSAAMTVTVSNGTTSNQSVASIVPPAGFGETDNCRSNGTPVPIPPNGTCTINVTFTPTSATQFQGNLQLSIQQGLGSPPPVPFNVALSGIGSNATFTLTIAPGSSPTATTNPGGTAAFGILVTGTQGIAQTVSLTAATTNPAQAQFIGVTVTPSSIKLTGTGNTQVAAVLETFCRGTGSVPAGPNSAPRSLPRSTGLGALLTALSFAVVAFTYRRQPRWAVALALLVLLGIGGMACGGDPGPSGPTPPGTYPVTLTATSGQQVVTLPVTLIVN